MPEGQTEEHSWFSFCLCLTRHFCFAIHLEHVFHIVIANLLLICDIRIYVFLVDNLLFVLISVGLAHRIRIVQLATAACYFTSHAPHHMRNSPSCNDPEVLANQRRISNPPFPSKVLQRVVAAQLLAISNSATSMRCSGLVSVPLTALRLLWSRSKTTWWVQLTLAINPPWSRHPPYLRSLSQDLPRLGLTSEISHVLNLNIQKMFFCLF